MDIPVFSQPNVIVRLMNRIALGDQMLTSRSKNVAITTMIYLAALVLAQWVLAAGYSKSRKDFPQTV